MVRKAFSIVAIEDDVNVVATINDFAIATEIEFTAFSGLDTLSIDALNNADLILLDLQLEHHDGIDVIRELDHSNVKTPIILCSGMDINVINASRDLLKEHNLTCYGQLQKPFSYAQLLEAISVIEDSKSAKPAAKVNRPTPLLTNQDIADAIDQQWFTVYYQPQINPSTGHISGIECLARMNHPEKGICGPYEFISQIKEFGLMDTFTKQIIKKGLKELSRAPVSKDTIFSFNLDAHSINSSFLMRLLDCLIEFAIPPSKICLEITELSALEINAEVKSILTKLRIRGFSLSMDDFGTGYSTIQELNELPFNEVKIDHSFVMSMETKDSSKAIVRSTIELAERLNYRVVAEGVETREQAVLLNEFGCQDVQGYYYCRPKPIVEFSVFCEQQERGSHDKQLTAN